MAVDRRRRQVLRVAGAACLIAGLFPYYWHSSGPPPNGDVPPVGLPGLGMSADRPSTTVVRVGLPFSPLFRYRRVIRFTTGPGPTSTARAGSGEAESPVAVKTAQFVTSYSFDWRIELLSGSTALAAVGIVLLLIPLRWPRGAVAADGEARGR